MPATGAASSKGIFAAATNSSNSLTRRAVRAIDQSFFLSFLDVHGIQSAEITHLIFVLNTIKYLDIYALNRFNLNI